MKVNVYVSYHVEDTEIQERFDNHYSELYPELDNELKRRIALEIAKNRFETCFNDGELFANDFGYQIVK